MFNTVGVQFIGQRSNNDREYAYLTDEELAVGDLVVVDTTNGIKTAKVVSLFCNELDAHKWIICKIDMELFETKLKELERKQFILKQMKQRSEQINVVEQYRLLAASDPKMKELLEAFETPLAETKEITE